MLRGIAKTTVASLDDASVDLDRCGRVGYQRLKEADQPVLATRVNDEQAASVLQAWPDFFHHEAARTIRSPTTGKKEERAAVVSAGTSDFPIAADAAETLHWMKVDVGLIQDVGVAGPHRLPAHLDQLEDMDAVVVVAGMEGLQLIMNCGSLRVISVPAVLLKRAAWNTDCL